MFLLDYRWERREGLLRTGSVGGEEPDHGIIGITRARNVDYGYLAARKGEPPRRRLPRLVRPVESLDNP